MEGDLSWKTTFDGRGTLIEDNLQQKMTFRRHPSEDDHQWKTTFDGRQPSMEDSPQWKTTFDGQQLLMEDNL